jgi:signal peptidase II
MFQRGFMNSKYIIVTVVSAFVILLDQATKIFIHRTMELHSSITVVENFVNITYIRNKGAAFGVLADSALRLPFLVGVSAVAIVVILFFVSRLRPEQTFSAFPMAMILAGALGNLIDRIRLGEVIDFLDVHWYQYHWPAFNVADSSICVGVFILALDMWYEEKRKKS